MSPTIQEQSDELKAASAQRLPTEVLETFARDQAAWRAQGRPSGAVAVGDVLEDFTLPDATGRDLTLSDLVADGPAVLVFYRGGWCPYCNLALHQYQSELGPQLPSYGATLAAISPQKPDESLSTAEKHGLEFAVLSDSGARVARRLGIGFEPARDVLDAQRTLGLDIRDGNVDGSPELPLPTVLVVDADRTVQFADVQADYTRRTEVSEILAALQRLG
ncbi:MAG: peroxiredoxin-like family protein [Solirubrobacteraceae bacterium]